MVPAVMAQQRHHGQLWPAAQQMSTAEQWIERWRQTPLLIRDSSALQLRLPCWGRIFSGFLEKQTVSLCIMTWSHQVRPPSPITSEGPFPLSASHLQSEGGTRSHCPQRGCLCGCTQWLQPYRCQHHSSGNPKNHLWHMYQQNLL